MRIGELAAQSGVNAQTVRYYERRGLLQEPERLSSGYRAYSAEAVRVIGFVKRAQELGFSLANVEVLLGLADGGPDSCQSARAIAQGKLDELDRKIADLQEMRGSLRQLVATCDLPREQRECPLLESIQETA